MSKNCQVFTSKNNIYEMLNIANYMDSEVLEKVVLENSCGNGQILMIIVEIFIDEARKKGLSDKEIKKKLEAQMIGFEIDKVVYLECLENLNNLLIEKNIGIVDWKIYNKDYLNFESKIDADLIIGNPPYVTYQDLTITERDFIRENFESCKVGKFDYCYSFIEKSLLDLKKHSGKLVYLIPSSIFKNVFGQGLRNMMLPNLKEIYDYKNLKIFDSVLVSASVIYIDNSIKSKAVKYIKVEEKKDLYIQKNNLISKWIFDGHSLEHKTINKDEQILGDYYKVSNSVATLLNNIFVISDFNDIDERYIKTGKYYIEKQILKKAASPRSMSQKKEEFIIFPYKYVNNKVIKYTEEEFKRNFPETHKYLKSNKKKLTERKADKNAQWFEYGRSQAIEFMNQEKLLVSSVLTKKIKIYKLDKNTIPYSGFYIIPTGAKNLNDARKIMESKKFLDYMNIQGINANGSSLRFSVNDFKNYTIPINNI